MYLEQINAPSDVRRFNSEQLCALADEMRTAMLNRLSKRGGHFGPNFGMVEATIALHYVFDSPQDKIVFDVSHQVYCHKLLTGRQAAFTDDERFGEASGYSNPDESEHDFFKIGHTSTSVSLACGLAKARDLKGESGNVIAVIGDGSLSGGEALEGLDFAAELGGNLIIVVNDNDMSIAENHGGLYDNLRRLRQSGGKCEQNLFRAMGLDYTFVPDGNDIGALIDAFKAVRGCERPTVVHICTEKGRGYAPAVADKENWHWSGPFDVQSGQPLCDGGDNYHDLTGRLLRSLMADDGSVVAITSGTPAVMGFSADMRAAAGRQFVDVGIAEEHAVALASGIATGGGKPFYGVYSSFIQRTYDQLSQDVCINGSPVTIAVFAASVYGMSDITHLGIFDIPLISNIPNMVYLAPTCREEYEAMVRWSMNQTDYPVAIRVPGDGVNSNRSMPIADYGRLNRSTVTHRGNGVAVIAVGSFYSLGEAALERLRGEGIDATLINPVYLTGLDTELLDSLTDDHRVVVTLEDGILDGGFGQKVAAYYGDSGMKVLCRGLKKEFIDRYDVDEILRQNGLTAEQIAADAIKAL